MLPKRVSITLLLTVGSLTSFVTKMIYQIPVTMPYDSAVDCDGFGVTCIPLPPDEKVHALIQYRHFEKPIMNEVFMFTGMVICLFMVSDWADSRARFRILIPTLFDVVGTALVNYGLLYVSASVYRMLCGTELVFCATGAVLFLGRKLLSKHYLAILMMVSAAVLVGAASMLNGDSAGSGSPKEQAVGMVLLAFSQLVFAAQNLVEESFMADMKVDAALIVGMEGAWGLLIMSPALLVAQFAPGSDVGGVLENTADSLMLMRTNHFVLASAIFLVFGFFVTNYALICMSGQLGATFRIVIDNLRTLIVWLVGLAVFTYTKDDPIPLGEEWQQYSYVQVIGFAVMILAVFVYQAGNDDLDIDEDEKVDAADVARAPSQVHSMNAMHSLQSGLSKGEAYERRTAATDIV